MSRLLSNEDARNLDRRAIHEAGVPGVVLMENASRGCADLLVALGIQGRIAICCGRGNNGGDGFAMARHLDNLGFDVRVLLFADPDTLSGDAAINYRIIARLGPPIVVFGDTSIDNANLHVELHRSDWVVDALFGTGLQGPVRAPLDQVITAINDSGARVFAIDIPSGLPDNGPPTGPTIRAHHTATIAVLKTAFLSPDAQSIVGQVHVIEMGLPHRILG